MYKISFVILHYMSYDFTKECIESILGNIKYSNYNIILVDNNSTNDSFNRLKEKFGNINNIYFIKNDDNLGFAKGNNVGYKFAKYELKSDFIILLNNDTIIEQENFLDLIVEKYEKYNFYVLGPDIVTSDGIHQNPQRIKVISYKGILKDLMINLLKLILTYLYIDIVLDFIKHKIKAYNNINKSLECNNVYYIKDLINVQLHGACLIFSPAYVKEYEGLYNKTFMYGEEHILFYTMSKENKKTLYSPHLKIYHREKGSTSYKEKSNRKRRFIFKNLVFSRLILLKYFSCYEIEKNNFLCSKR